MSDAIIARALHVLAVVISVGDVSIDDRCLVAIRLGSLREEWSVFLRWLHSAPREQWEFAETAKGKAEE